MIDCAPGGLVNASQIGVGFPTTPLVLPPLILSRSKCCGKNWANIWTLRFCLVIVIVMTCNCQKIFQKVSTFLKILDYKKIQVAKLFNSIPPELHQLLQLCGDGHEPHLQHGRLHARPGARLTATILQSDSLIQTIRLPASVNTRKLLMFTCAAGHLRVSTGHALERPGG